MLRFSPPFMLLSIQRSVRRRCRLLLFCSVLCVFLPLHRAYRSFKLFMPPFDLILYRQRSSRPCVVVTPSAFLHFFLSRVVRAVVLLVIDAYVHTLYTLLDPFPFCTHSLSHLIPHSICSARFYFLFRVTCGSRFACPILMRGGSYGLA